MMLRCGSIALALVLGLAGASARAQQPLEWKFKKDDAFRYKTVSTLKQIMKLLDKAGKPEGKELVQDIEYTIVVGYKVLDVTKDGGAVLEMKVESMSFKNAASIGAPAVDDDKVKGATFKLTLSAKREPTKIEGYDEFLKKMAGDDNNVLKTLQAVLPKETLMKSARDAFGFLPEKDEKT